MALPRPFTVPTQAPHPHDYEAPDKWLTRWMRNRGMTDAALLKAIQELGYEGTRPGNIANWRKGDATIPPEVFPKLFLALGFTEAQAAHWTCDILKQAYPDIAEFIRDPVKEAGIRLRLKLLELPETKRPKTTSTTDNI